MHYIVFDALNALLPQRIPQIQCCLSVSAPHDGSVNGVQVVDSLLNLFDMFHTCDRDATGHRAAEHLVSRNCDRINWLLEGYFRGVVNKGQHHGEERAIAVDMKSVSSESEVLQNTEDTVKVVHCTLDCRSHIHVDDRRPVLVLG